MKGEVTRQDVIYYIWHFGNLDKLCEVTKAAGKTRKLKQIKRENANDTLIGAVVDQFLNGYFKKEDADFINNEVERLERNFDGWIDWDANW